VCVRRRHKPFRTLIKFQGVLKVIANFLYLIVACYHGDNERRRDHDGLGVGEL